MVRKNDVDGSVEQSFQDDEGALLRGDATFCGVTKQYLQIEAISVISTFGRVCGLRLKRTKGQTRCRTVPLAAGRVWQCGRV